MGAQRIVDVREDIRRGDEPFDRIMQAVAELEGDQELSGGECLRTDTALRRARTAGLLS